MKRGRQTLEAGCQVFAQMDPQGPASAFRQDLEVSPGLRRFHHAERVLLPGHGQVGGIVAGDLQKDSAVRSALVGLAGGMEEARTKSETGGHSLPVAQRQAQFLQKRFVRGIHLDVSQQGKVIAGTRALDVGAQISRQRLVAARGFGQGVGVDRDR